MTIRFSCGSENNWINTTEIEQQAEKHWRWHSFWTDQELCIVGVGKNS